MMNTSCLEKLKILKGRRDRKREKFIKSIRIHQLLEIKKEKDHKQQSHS